MRINYSTISPWQDESDSLPRIPLRLSYTNHSVEVIGLVDSGATVNVLPYEAGLDLGGIWDEQKAIIQLDGNLGENPAIPFFAAAKIGDFEPVRLAFAWVSIPHAPLILEQTNFFMEFDVCFYRSQLAFEINLKA